MVLVAQTQAPRSDDYTGKNACATKEEFIHLFLNDSLLHRMNSDHAPQHRSRTRRTGDNKFPA